MSGAVDPLGPVDLLASMVAVDLIAAAVRGCPAVAGLHGGRFGQSTTYLPGRRVIGVRIAPAEIVVGVVGRYPITVAETAAQIRTVVYALAPGIPVSVTVEDLLMPEHAVPPHPPLATPLAPPEQERLV